MTKREMLDFLRELREKDLNHQAIITNTTSDTYQRLIQDRIDAYNAIIQYIEVARL